MINSESLRYIHFFCRTDIIKKITNTRRSRASLVIQSRMEWDSWRLPHYSYLLMKVKTVNST